MPSPDNIIPPHNIIPLRIIKMHELAAARPRGEVNAPAPPPINLNDAFAETLQLEPYRREPLFDRIGDALGSRTAFIFYCGFYAGAMMTVGIALIVARFGL